MPHCATASNQGSPSGIPRPGRQPAEATAGRQNLSIPFATLDASDYGLLDEKTLAPRPDYWAAWLWRKLMGTTVLDPGPSPAPNLHLYAHCLRNQPGGVVVLAINADKESGETLQAPHGAERYTLTSSELMSPTVDLNGKRLQLGPGDALPALQGRVVHSGTIQLAPASITFLTFAKAGNESCR